MTQNDWFFAALELRAKYLVEHAAAIYVRVRIGERWEDYPLSELRGAMAIEEGFRLLLRDEVPHRVVRAGVSKPERIS